MTDPLTGLPNQRFVADHVARELVKARRNGRALAIVVLDLDGFKDINDRCGHAAGDAALRYVAQCLKHGVRADDVCARYGGDEFLLVMPDCGASEARHRIEDVTCAVAALTAEARQAFGSLLTISGGAAVFPDDGDQFEGLFAVADSRMYQGKFQRRASAHPVASADSHLCRRMPRFETPRSSKHPRSES